MTSITTAQFRISLPLLVIVSFFTPTSAYAAGMDHSKHKMGDMSKTSKQKASRDSSWPKTKGKKAWSDEEFEPSKLAEELNTEIGVVVHHQHESGNWMIGYKNMRMLMQGLIRGTQERKSNETVTTQEISRTVMGSDPLTPVTGFNYLMAPLKMDMNMQMVTAMYGVTQKASIMVMANYVKNDMGMVMHMGDPTTIMRSRVSKMSTSGLGDTVVNLMVRASSEWTISMGVSVPTGNINNKVLMNGNVVQAPYKMQLGSGTVDLLQTITYKGGDNSFNWGYQQSFVYHSGSNSNGYVIGDKFEVNAWLRKTSVSNLSISARVKVFDQSQIEGRDSRIMNLSMSPAFDPDNSGRHETDFSLGISKRFNSGHRIGFEYTEPIKQLVHGIQMKTVSSYTISWAYMM